MCVWRGTARGLYTWCDDLPACRDEQRRRIDPGSVRTTLGHPGGDPLLPDVTGLRQPVLPVPKRPRPEGRLGGENEGREHSGGQVELLPSGPHAENALLSASLLAGRVQEILQAQVRIFPYIRWSRTARNTDRLT